MDANWHYDLQPTAFSRLSENVQGLIAESITGKLGTLKQQNVQLAEELSRTRAGVGGGLQKKDERHASFVEKIQTKIDMNYPDEIKNILEREKQYQLKILKKKISKKDSRKSGLLEIPDSIDEFPPDFVLPDELERLQITGKGQTLKNLPVFPNSLTVLSINYIKISSLQEFSHIPLKTLKIEKVNIQSLPELPSTLEELHCSFTNLEELPVLPASLKKLMVRDGKLTSIPDLPENLEVLDCQTNLIESLPELEHTKLKILYCGYNKITNIPKLPPSLNNLFLSSNLCQELPDFPNSIKNVHCDYNNLKMIPKLPNGINYFSANNNLCKVLPNIPKSLKNFYFDNNPLVEPYASIYNTWRTKKFKYSIEDPLGISNLHDILRKKTEIYEKRTQLSNLKNMANRNETGANWYYGPQPTAFSRLPENVQGLIAESITGKRGTLKQQNVQLAEELSRPIIESSNGGGFKRKQRRKTLRKKRTSK